MSDELESLGPLALRTLAAERGRGDIDAAMQERLLGRVVATVAVAGAVSLAAGSAAAAAGNAGTGAAAGAGAAGGTSIAAGLTIKALPWIIGAFVAGGGTGAAIHAAVAPSASSPPQSSPHVARVVPSAAPVAPPLPVVSAEPALSSMPVGSLPAATSTAPPAPRPSASSAQGAAGSDVDLAAERALVDRARAALSRGQSRDALDALDALDTHTTRYPRGRLSEEREALAVDALARAGRLDDARARASRFHAAYLNSVFGGVVDAAIAPR